MRAFIHAEHKSVDTSASISVQQSPAPGAKAVGPLAKRGDSPLFNLEYFEVEWERLCNSGIQMVTLLIIRVEGVAAAPPSDHEAANLSLLRAAQVFEASVRKNDFLARLSHNEFGLLLPRADARVAGLVTFSPDGTYIASAAGVGSIRLWSSRSNRSGE